VGSLNNRRTQISVSISKGIEVNDIGFELTCQALQPCAAGINFRPWVVHPLQLCYPMLPIQSLYRSNAGTLGLCDGWSESGQLNLHSLPNKGRGQFGNKGPYTSNRVAGKQNALRITGHLVTITFQLN
jgi:hypothetical protein